MAVQWFPGHMVLARKKAAKAMAMIDVVIEVLDARLPEASTNPMIRELREQRQRPCLKVLSKPDLADPDVTKDWLEFYNTQENVKAVAICCKTAGEVARIPGFCQSLAPHRNDATKPLRMMIMGIPNVGKSTMMNAMVKRKIAKVGNEPAITKSQQMLKISARYSVTDTPGLMWPKIEYPGDGFMLAASHAISRNAMDDEEVALFLADILLDRYPERLAGRYGFPVDGLTPQALIEGVAKRRALVVRGGEADLEKASSAFLQDYRQGRLGRISLETPETRQAMLVAHSSSDNSDPDLEKETHPTDMA